MFHKIPTEVVTRLAMQEDEASQDAELPTFAQIHHEDRADGFRAALALDAQNIAMHRVASDDLAQIIKEREASSWTTVRAMLLIGGFIVGLFFSVYLYEGGTIAWLLSKAAQ